MASTALAPRDRHPGLRHPLMGARLSTLIDAWSRNGFVPMRYWPLVGAMVGSAAVRAPFGWYETFAFHRQRRAAPPMKPPVFIVGHWRSGTTHLHNVLGRSPAFGHISPLASGMPDQLLTLATWLRPWLERALPEDRHVDRVSVDPDSPQEDEIPLASQQGISIFHALYFPSRFVREAHRGIFFDGCHEREIARWERRMTRFLEKVSVHQEGRRLLVKNPVYTARLERLHRLWPEARFIHIHRNPYEVFASSVHYHRAMLAELALQAFDHVDIERFVLETYVRLMNAFDIQSRKLPPGHLVEVSFEELQRAPLSTLRYIHERLGLEDWAEAQPLMERYLASLGDYRKNRFAYPTSLIEQVDAAWGDWVARWGYRPPE